MPPYMPNQLANKLFNNTKLKTAVNAKWILPFGSDGWGQLSWAWGKHVYSSSKFSCGIIPNHVQIKKQKCARNKMQDLYKNTSNLSFTHLILML